MKISIWGSYSGINKGDTAILQSIIDQISKREPDVEYLISSKHPSELKKCINGRRVSIKRSLTSYIGLHTITYLKNSDFILIGGGGLFFDRALLNPFKNHIINLFFLTLLKKIFSKKPTIIFCVGSSHLNSQIAKYMTKFILAHADLIYVRDELSKKIFSELTKKDIFVFSDPVFLLKPQKTQRVTSIASNLKKDSKKHNILLCINDSLFSVKNIKKTHMDLVHTINQLALDYSVFLYQNDRYQKTIKSIRHLLHADISYFNSNELCPREIIYFFSQFDFVISSPMHGLLFAYQAKTKLVSINYDLKVNQFNQLICNKNQTEPDALSKLPFIIEHYQEIQSNSTMKKQALSAFNALHDFIKNNKK